MERKDINFGVEKIDHKWYFHFDAHSGTVNSMSVYKENSSIEIPEQLAMNIHNGIDNMAFYKVLFENGKYKYVNVVQATPEITDEKTDFDVNQSYYKIFENNADAQINFNHIGTTIKISATKSMKNIFKETFSHSEENLHKFYVCKKNDLSIMYKFLNINLTELINTDIEVEIGYKKSDCSVYCRKIFDYNYV